MNMILLVHLFASLILCLWFFSNCVGLRCASQNAWNRKKVGFSLECLLWKQREKVESDRHYGLFKVALLEGIKFYLNCVFSAVLPFQLDWSSLWRPINLSIQFLSDVSQLWKCAFWYSVAFPSFWLMSVEVSQIHLEVVVDALCSFHEKGIFCVLKVNWVLHDSACL